MGALGEGTGNQPLPVPGLAQVRTTMSSFAGDDSCTGRGSRQRQIKTSGSAICFQGVVFGRLSEDNFRGGLVQEDRKSNLG